MSYDPLKYLELCDALCKNCDIDKETLTRTIIGRAYYSAFLFSREYMKKKRLATFAGKGTDHVIVETKLMQIDRTLGSVMRTLRENRKAADYNLSNPAKIKLDDRSVKTRALFFMITEQKDSVDSARYISHNLPKKLK